MPRIFKGSESTLRLLISKGNEYKSLTNLRIKLYTTKIEDAIEVIDGIAMEDNMAVLNLAPRAFVAMEDGVINYVVEGTIDGDAYYMVRQSNYMLKTLSYINEDGVAAKTIVANKNGEYRITPNDGLYVDIDVNIPIQEFKPIRITSNTLERITPDEGFEGIKGIDLDVFIPIQDTKKVTLKDNQSYTIKSDEGFEGIQEVNVTVDVPIQKTKELTVTTNNTYRIQPDTEFKGIEAVNVTVDVPVLKVQPKVLVDLKPGDAGSILPEDGYDGLAGVEYSVKDGGGSGKRRLPNGICLSGSTFTEFDGKDWDWSGIYDCNDLFRDCKNLISISNLNISPKSCYGMFTGCENLQTLDTSKWITNRFTLLNTMFNQCRNLTNLDVSKWDVSRVVSMFMTFNGCYCLTTLDVSNWNTSRVTDLKQTFSGCFNLTNLDVSKWDVSRVTNFEGTFEYCQKLKRLDLSKWKSERVYNISNMFLECQELEELDLSGIDLSYVTNLNNMFGNCKKLTKVKLAGDVSQVTMAISMFSGITTNGTLYYPAQYDYSKIIAELPSTWTAVPY